MVFDCGVLKPDAEVEWQAHGRGTSHGFVHIGTSVGDLSFRVHIEYIVCIAITRLIPDLFVFVVPTSSYNWWMADEPKKARSGAKLPKSEITTIRLDPKLRYLAELAARKQRRSLSSFIEWAIEHTLSGIPLKEGPDWMVSVMSEAESLWDVDAADRFAKLALKYPELLTHDEQVLWKLVRESGIFWRGTWDGYGADDWRWTVTEGSLIYARLREQWELLLQIAAGEMPAVMLPSPAKPKRAPPAPPSRGATKSGFDDMDDELPN